MFICVKNKLDKKSYAYIHMLHVYMWRGKGYTKQRESKGGREREKRGEERESEKASQKLMRVLFKSIILNILFVFDNK